MAWVCLLSTLLPLTLTSSSPELYRSLVEDRFLTDRNDNFDPIFTDLDLGYRDSFKRDLLSNDLAQDGVSVFLFNEKTDDTSSPFPAPRIARFVNLGGFQSQSNPIHFFEPPRNLASAPDSFAVAPQPALSESEFSPAPPQPAAQTLAQTHKDNSQGFSVKPFTFFNLGSASLSQPPPKQPLITAPQQPVAPSIISFSPPQQPQQQPQLQPQPQPQQFTLLPQQQFSMPRATFPQQPALLPTTQEFIPQQHPANVVSLPQPQQQQVPDAVMEVSRSRDNVGADMFSFPRARDPAPRPVTPGSVLFPNRNETLDSEGRVSQEFPDISENLVESQGSGGITGDKEFNIFEYIGRPTADRGVRKKQNGDKKRMGKLDALSILMSIAGASWEKDLVMGSKNEAGAGNTGSSFVCPALSGHFPDPDTCSVYYTCAGGTSHRNTCQTGLMYNSLTNQCDWEASVDCSINKAFFSASARP